jgi:hypothetical protein
MVWFLPLNLLTIFFFLIFFVFFCTYRTFCLHLIGALSSSSTLEKGESQLPPHPKQKKPPKPKTQEFSQNERKKKKI